MASSAAGSEAPTVLDKQQFSQLLKVPAVRVPTSKCQALMKSLRGFTLNLPKVRCIVPDGDSKDTRLLLLEDSGLQGLSGNLQELVKMQTLGTTEYTLSLDYTNFPTDQILKKILPPGVEAQTAFETIGHIAHLNLREECLPYKHLIGQVILDKNPHIRTIVNKVGQIENEYRVFQMEVIAGEASFETELVQCGVKFRLDFSKVYWNSRLETEHKRLVATFSPIDVILDVMAGVGPFAVPAGKLGCSVYANDLNPESVVFLKENIRINKVGNRVRAFNMDGRYFIRELLQRGCKGLPSTQGPQPPAAAVGKSSTDAPQQNGPTAAKPADAALLAGNEGIFPTHVIMNLPASAVEFLDAFRGAFPWAHWRDRALPLVHCYTFKKSTETEADVVSRVERYLGGKLEAIPHVHTVRSVAPGKLMFCVSFHVPKPVAFLGQEGWPAGQEARVIDHVGESSTDSRHVQAENVFDRPIGAIKRQKLDADTVQDTQL